MQYERCTQKKLRNLFEFLDKDGDGKISEESLASGLSQLQAYSDDDLDPNESVSCEYNAEEILRSLPRCV